MHKGKPLQIFEFGSGDNPLNSLADSPQKKYILAYLSGLSSVSVLVEQNYFDRDYLDEFSAFYSRSAKGYSNICQRLHFFSREIDQEQLATALANQKHALQDFYLGFIVIRPLAKSPFGRTVLALYPNVERHSERVTPELRTYTCNILGLELQVNGIPWQQQDRGVSACATIALWSMGHSSAFDANHSVPTTVEITQNALGSSTGARAFPSQGLSIVELKEAIYAQRLNPKVLLPTKYDSETKISGFERGYLASMCAANIRSGYLVLFVGDYIHAESSQQHAICCIGFREKEQQVKPVGSYTTMDDETEVFYIHDDNIGPNVRCRLVEENGFGVMMTEAPVYIKRENAEPQNDFKFRPLMMITAVHEEVRMDAEALIGQAKHVAAVLSNLLNNVYQKLELPQPALSYNAQFLDVRKFFRDHLAKVVSDEVLLAKVRCSLGEDAPPLCLHIGLISIGVVGAETQRLVDIIYDTTDSSLECPVVASILYDSALADFLGKFPSDQVKVLFGCLIHGYEA